MSIEVMKQALEALEKSVSTCFDRYSHEQVLSRPEHFINQTITALRLAIEQAERVKRAEEAFAAASDEMKGEQAERQELVCEYCGGDRFIAPPQQPEALRLADEIGEDYCRCLPAYKDRGRTDPQCESCNTEDWRHEAAAELRRLHSVNEKLLEALHSISLASQDSGSTREGMGLYARAAIAAAIRARKELK
jgi:hypothetical protein